MMDKGEFHALIRLLDDGDREVYENVQDKLISLGIDAVPDLEREWERTFDPLLQERLEWVIHHIQFERTHQEFAQWLADGADNFLDVALILVRYQYPGYDIPKLISRLDDIERDAWLEMSHFLSPIEKVNIVNQVIYRLHRFKGVSIDQKDPQHLFLNTLLDTRNGNALALGILYLILCQALSMPVYGVNLVNHFILCYTRSSDTNFKLSPHELKKEVLFYINPVNAGLIFTKDEVDGYLNKIKAEPRDEYYAPLSHIQSVHVILITLQRVYQTSGKPERAQEIATLLELLDNK